MANGYIVYEGKSKIDHKPIVVIATGFDRPSANEKTGPMIQVWILRARINPVRAIYSGGDMSICGNCPLRGGKEGSRYAKNRICYVETQNAPGQVYRAYRAGNYPKISPHDLPSVFAGLKVRLGAYGDPAAVPISIWHKLLLHAKAWTGYTHQWRERWCAAGLQNYVMASTETEGDTAIARSKGWRTFRVRRADEQLLADEIVCPASEEGGKRRTCATCLACDGGNAGKRSIAIIAHGGYAIDTRFARTQSPLIQG